MRVVDEQQRAAGPGDAVQRWQRREVAVGGEHRVGDDDGVAPWLPGQRRVDRLDIGMRDDQHPRAGEAAGVDQRRVIAFV